MRLTDYFEIHRSVEINGEIASVLPSKSVARELYNLKIVNKITDLHMQCELILFKNSRDIFGVSRVGIRLICDYVFCTEGKIFLLCKYKPDDIASEYKLSFVHNTMPNCLLVHNYSKILEYINKFGG